MFAIRDMETGFFLPQGRARGFTHDEPTNKKPPRLFVTRGGAEQALRWWKSGEWSAHWAYTYEGNEDYLFKNKARLDRINSHMEVVEIILAIPVRNK